MGDIGFVSSDFSGTFCVDEDCADCTDDAFCSPAGLKDIGCVRSGSDDTPLVDLLSIGSVALDVGRK